MADTSGNVPNDQLLPSFSGSSSSDEGIREDNVKSSNVNHVSSSTLNDKGMSLHSFPVESEIFTQKGQFSIQTVINDSYVRYRPQGGMGVANFSMDIPARLKNFQLSTFRFEFKPYQPSLSQFSVILPQIKGKKKNLESKETITSKKIPDFCLQNVSSLDISNVVTMSSATFHQEIPTKFPSEPSESLKKLERQMMSLQKVFKRVKVTRELNIYTVKKDAKNDGRVEIKQFIEHVATQTLQSTSQNTDFSVNKIEALILECEFFRAAVSMIKKYPFYYDFLKKSYAERNFDRLGKLRHLRPKQRNFKRAVIHAHGCSKSHLEAVNSILSEFLDGEKKQCLCLE